MWPDCLIVAAIGGLVALDTTAAWQVMICRPVVSGPLIGWLLGDPGTGLLIGAVMELVWAGFVPAGASVFPDSNVAIVVAVALAIRLQQETGSASVPLLLAILYSVPVAFLGSRTIVWMRGRNDLLLGKAVRCAAEGDGEGVTRCNDVGAIYSWGRGLVFSAVMFAVGLIALRICSRHLPLIHGDVNDLVRVLLGALGVAVLLTIFASRRTTLFLVLGLLGGLLWSFL